MIILPPECSAATQAVLLLEQTLLIGRGMIVVDHGLASCPAAHVNQWFERSFSARLDDALRQRPVGALFVLTGGGEALLERVLGKMDGA